MKFKHYSNEDYEAVCKFLIELNRENQNHINWNWARFEWMMPNAPSPVESREAPPTSSFPGFSEPP